VFMKRADTGEIKDKEMADNSVAHLNQNYGIPNRIIFVQGEGGLVKARLTLEKGTSTELYLHGAQAVSFKLETGEDVFFLSSKAIFHNAKPIRGGIPVIFPQFGPGTLPQHGFLRTSDDWTVIKTGSLSPNQASITLQFADTAETRKMWDHSFKVLITVAITYDETKKSQFIQNFEVVNNNKVGDFEFTNALHTYFTTSDIHKTSVSPLNNITYFDKPTKTYQKQTSDSVHFSGETDRVYQKAPNTLYIHSPEHVTTIEKINFSDAVLWNAWSELIKTIADLGPEEWKTYVCCEVGNIATPVKLTPLESWQGTQIISRKPVTHANV